MRWPTRVKQWRIRRLYNLSQLGIYDDELLIEVGWGLYARCQAVLMVARAIGGEVPCLGCGQIVYREKYYRNLKLRQSRNSAPSFACPSCNKVLTWYACRDALHDYPRCFACQLPLDWHYVENRLSCQYCGKDWSWKQYRQSVSRRKWLPCPYCHSVIRRPESPPHEAQVTNDSDDTDSIWGELTCPHCKGAAIHEAGKFRCRHCSYEKPWRTYVKRLKRRVERLECSACGYEFTWNAWRKQYLDKHLATGNTAPAEEFQSKWLRCKTPQEQLMQIDVLLHALHGRGALAPNFIEDSPITVLKFLDELARQN